MNADVPAGVGAPPLDTRLLSIGFIRFLFSKCISRACQSKGDGALNVKTPISRGIWEHNYFLI